MKKIAKLITAIVTVAILITFMVLCKVITIDVDFNLSGVLGNVCAWIVIPLASIIIGVLYLKKYLWLSLIAVFVLEMSLVFIVTGGVPIYPFNYGYNTEGLALIGLLIQSVMTLVIIGGIYAFRAFRKPKTAKT